MPATRLFRRPAFCLLALLLLAASLPCLGEEALAPAPAATSPGASPLQDSSHLVYTLLALGLASLAGNIVLGRRATKLAKQCRYVEQNYQTFLESSPYLIFMLNDQGQVLRANRAARERLFRGKEGLKFFSFLDQEGKNRLRRLLDVASQRPEREELYFYLRPDAPLLLEIDAFPNRNGPDGAPVICCIASDLAYRLKMESELVEAERMVVIGKMAAGIAHEVNNPLNIILTNAELMQEMTEDKELAPCIRAILHNVDRAAGIIRQLLQLSTPARLELSTVNLSEVARNCLTFLKPRLKHMEVNLEKLPESLPMRGDKAQLEQLILNLLLNALASMGDTGKLSLSGCLNPEKDSIRLEIRDSGKGIAQENLERIFDIFFTTRNREGFGLGLFLCRRIAERHTGLLFAESEKGQGATFILELPTEKRHIL